MPYDYDLFVIGGGSGGIATARRAAGHGARVGLAEADRLGGTCVNRGCIPKKLMVHAAHLADGFEDARSYGWRLGQPSFDWAHLVAAIDREVERLNGVYQRTLDKAGVEAFDAYAKLLDAHTIDLGDRKVSADKIAIAVGGHPVKPEVPGMEHALVSDDVFRLRQQPPRVAIVGGGYIATEFACILHGLGSEVTQIVRRERILRSFDSDIRTGVQDTMQQRGIQLLPESDVARIDKQADGSYQVTTQGAHAQTVTVDAVLAATGRAPNLQNLGLENAGVETDRGAVGVDGYSRTSQPHIFAVGDCTNRINLTPVAINEGRALADTEFGGQGRGMAYENVPSAVFTIPEAATVGLTEALARERHGEAIAVHRARFRATHLSLTDRDEKTTVKLVVDSGTDRVLGAHMVGEGAAEIVQGVAITLKMGATKADFNATVGIHPTVAEEFVTL